MLLAGILLKIGTYGFLRFSIPMLPVATAACAPWLLWLSVVGIIYGALVALAQADIKRLIAYSSVSHLGYCMLGLFALTPVAMQGSVLQMINHGLSTGGLFALVGMIYERYHTREIRQFGGLTRKTPYLAAMFVFFTFSSIGLPGLNGFAGEFLILSGMFQRAMTHLPHALGDQFKTIIFLAVFGVVLGAWYMLWLVQRVFFGTLREPDPNDAHGHGGHGSAGAQATAAEPIHDLNLREFCALAPLVVFIFWIGLFPGFFLRPIESAVTDASAAAMLAFDRQYIQPEPAVDSTATASRLNTDAAAPVLAQRAAAVVRGESTRDQ